MSTKMNIFDKIKSFIGDIGFSLFLWSLGMTNSQYLDQMCGKSEGE